VQRVEVLAGNVGYLNLTAFFRIEEARDAIAAAMQTLRHADALILDLRDNGGGNPDTVTLLASYCFAEQGLPLFEIVPRSGEARRYKTASDGVFERNETRSMYVLISPRTFSAGEGMAFLLQERGRAEIIGETTAGAANPGRPYPAGDHFEVTIPNGQVRTSIKGTNWEGDGVSPDVKVDAADALHVAHVRALRQLIEHTEPGEWRETLERHVKEQGDK
jgi:C-terminal processing protease CtpA/Prc